MGFYGVCQNIITNRPGYLRRFVGATSKANGKHEVIYDECAWLCIYALDLHRPFLRFRVLRCPSDSGGRPHVQFERVRITLEPICDLPHFVSVHAIGSVGFLCHFRCRRMYRPGWREAASVRPCKWLDYATAYCRYMEGREVLTVCMACDHTLTAALSRKNYERTRQKDVQTVSCRQSAS
jgi:hypothetical protein